MTRSVGIVSRLFLAGLIVAVCVRCAPVGPDYARPKFPLAEKWNTAPGTGLHAGAVDPAELGTWWEMLHDPVLTGLIRRAIAGSLDVKKAKAKVREARARTGVARAEYFPKLDASGAYTKSRSTDVSGNAPETDLFSALLDSRWELDIFGGTRRAVEAARETEEASRESLRDTLVSLTAELGLNYVGARTYQMRIAVAQDNLKAQEETYQLARWKYLAGLDTELAVQQARYNLEYTRSQIPALRTGLEESMNRIAVLLGEQPGGVHAELAPAGPIPVPPREAAVGVPADVLRQRPDVRKAERELAAQTAQVGVATAELYPKLTLKGSIGLNAETLSTQFLTGSHSYSVGPSLALPVFRGGAIRKNIEVQSALQEQALVAYESGVLTALEEVENALAAYEQEHDTRRALAESAEAARQAATLAESMYSAGSKDFTSVLEAQRSLLTYQDQLAKSEGTVTSNFIRLYKALGGGWTVVLPETAELKNRQDSVGGHDKL
ncbi:MAG: efflux transporter outer membrane subunit [Syntrophobacteraceae bacterium]|nr:efflux transporter outer membrane subunit [Desulfobacteraceae bacterium]